MRYPVYVLFRWLIHQEQFDPWANVLAANDNVAPARPDLQDETIPAVNLLSFY
jgi:hypothetical protein